MPAGALAGLCPACLLAQGAETEGGEPGAAGRFEPPPVEELAKLFPQLELLSLLGAGGMGAVYKARQPALDRLVALKVLPSKGAGGANFEERFNREARALARLSHPNIVAVHEFGKAGGLHFFIMEFVDGANLRQLEQAGRLSPREALQIIPQICDALQYAHDEGVVHRDIKPENVLVDRKGRVKIADFGLAKILGVEAESLRLTVEGQVMGTPHYMAPEQVVRPLAVDHRADIYSLGVVLYEMLTGDLPLGKFAPPSRKVSVDVRFDEVVLRALENDPERRYQRASEVKTQVENIAGTAVPAASGPTASATAETRHEQEWVRWAGFRLARVRDGSRRLHWKGILQGWAILFAVLTIAFGVVSVIAGKPLFGWLGIVGWPSMLVRAAVSGVLIAIGAWRAMRRVADSGSASGQPRTPQGTLILGAGGAAAGLSPAGLERIRQELRRPAIGLLVAGVANWILIPLAIIAILWLAQGAQGEAAEMTRANIVLVALGVGMLALCGFLIAVSFKMRRLENYWAAVVASVLAMIVSPGNIVGLPMGIWALTVLLRREVREAFRAMSRQEQPTRDWWWTTRRGALTLIFLCVAVLGVAALRLSPPTEEPAFKYQVAQCDEQTGRLVAKLPGRGMVELMAIGDAYAALNGWWSASGLPLTNEFYEVRDGIDNKTGGCVSKDLIFRDIDLPDGASSGNIEAVPVSGGGSGGEIALNGKLVRGGRQVRMAWEPQVRSATVFLGYGLEPWRTIGSHRVVSQSYGQQRAAGGPNWYINFHHAPTDTKDGAQIAVVFGPEDKQWMHRMMAIDTNGVEYPATTSNGTPIEKLTLWTYTFYRLPLRAVKEFRLQVRPVHWIAFRDVAVVPHSPLPEPKRPKFGPVLECYLHATVDFDSGKTRQLALGRNEQAAALQKEGIDAVVGAGVLDVFDMDFVLLSNSDWDDIRPHELVERIYHDRYHPNEVKPLHEGQLPATFGFRTREQRMGILQLLPFEDANSGAKMRYKLIESPVPQ